MTQINNFPITAVSPADLTTATPVSTDKVFVVQGNVVKTTTIAAAVASVSKQITYSDAATTTTIANGVMVYNFTTNALKPVILMDGFELSEVAGDYTWAANTPSAGSGVLTFLPGVKLPSASLIARKFTT